MNSEDISRLICKKHNINSDRVLKQLSIFVRKYDSYRKKRYVYYIKDLIRMEYLKREKPYMCSMCKKEHDDGDIHKNHIKYFLP